MDAAPQKNVTKTVLGNGLTILVDRVPHYRSVAVSVDLLGGSRDETESGSTHLLEHLLFKRTRRSSVRQIAERLDELGGEVNAFTEPEALTLYAVASKGALVPLCELFAELLLEADFREPDLRVEKQIVRQEIIGMKDDLHDAAYQRFREIFWPDHGLGRPVVGTLESVQALGTTGIRARLAELLVGARVVFSVAGDIAPDAVCTEVERLFSALPPGARPPSLPVRAGFGRDSFERSVSQVSLVLAYEWPHLLDRESVAGLIGANVIGHGNASRLFQALREEEGLCYDISTTVDAYRDTGALVIAGSFECAQIKQALDGLWREMERLAQHGVSAEEFHRAQQMLSSQVEMEEDTLRGRLWRMVESEMLYGRYESADEVLARIAQQRLEDVNGCLRERLRDERSVLVLGGDVPAGIELTKKGS